MNILDFILVGLLSIGAIRGFRKGIILEVAGLLALFLALFGAFQLVDWGVTFLQGFGVASHNILPIVAFVILFIAILIGVYLLGRITKAAFHITPFGLFDNLVGGIVGTLKWALGISLVFWVLDVLEVKIRHEQAENSLVLPYVLFIAPVFIDFIASFIPYFQELIASIEALFKQSKH